MNKLPPGCVTGEASRSTPIVACRVASSATCFRALAGAAVLPVRTGRDVRKGRKPDPKNNTAASEERGDLPLALLAS